MTTETQTGEWTVTIVTARDGEEPRASTHACYVERWPGAVVRPEADRRAEAVLGAVNRQHGPGAIVEGGMIVRADSMRPHGARHVLAHLVSAEAAPR